MTEKVRRMLESKKLGGFECFWPDGSAIAKEVVADLRAGRDPLCLPCNFCKAQNSCGPYGCPLNGED